MTCADIELASASYFEGTLGLEESRAFHRHLSECDHCMIHCIAYQWVLQLLHENKEEFRAAIHERID